MGDRTTEPEFLKAVASFRDYMGYTTWTAEQRRNGFKMFALTYLRLENSDEATRERLFDVFWTTMQEYKRRMELMGMEP